MSYSRKEILNWVQSQTKYKFQQLRNGVFFCQILQVLYPEEAGKIKFNPNPVSQYDYSINLTAMKKVLDKHGVSHNININTVLSSKNNFEIAKMFKTLFDGNGSIQKREDISLTSRTSFLKSQRKEEIGRNINQEFPLIKTASKQAKVKSIVAEKSIIKGKAMKLEMKNDESAFLKEKANNYSQILQRKMQKQDIVIENDQLKDILPNFNCDPKLAQMLYERALYQSIQSFINIISKIEANVELQFEVFEDFRMKMKSCILQK